MRAAIPPGLQAAGALVAVLVLACGSSATSTTDAGGGPIPSRAHASDVPIDGLSAEDVGRFNEADGLFDLPFRDADGLGPLYIRDGCGECHAGASRGPGLAQRMSVVQADGITASPDQSLLKWGHAPRLGLAAGAKTPIVPPSDPSVKVSTRLGPPVLGRGYIEAIDDAEIERVEADQSARTDGIHGRINRVIFHSVPNSDAVFGLFTTGQSNLIGRFGLKARIVTLDDFTADAYQGDMGMTTPMRPTELPNPDGLTDDDKPGIDLDIDHVNKVAFYLRRIAIPLRVGLTTRGQTLFDQAKCSVCHVPSLKTRRDYPIAQLAGIDAPVYTDVLLHDLGSALADGMTDESARSTEWRTAPLIGLRFSKEFLHDGRAATVADAIVAHDGEAKVSTDLFRALSPDDQGALVQFVEAL